MPSATPELRDLMLNWFGDISDEGPTRVLLSRGWKLTHDWRWKPPTPHYTIHEIDYKLILFMVQEWDYGGLCDDPWLAMANVEE